MVTRSMIMAAGIGSRLEPLTSCKPKPMVPVANIPVMEHILKVLRKHNIKDVIANTHYLSTQITEYFKHIKPDGINLEFLHEAELSGTAGGVKKCESFLSKGETFVVMSGDSLTDVNLSLLIDKHKKAGAMISMGLKSVPNEDVVNLGVVVTDKTGKVLEFQEKPSIEEAKSNLVNTGIYIFEPELFNFIPKNTFYDFAKQVFPSVMNANKPIYGFVIEEYWNDIGTLLQYRLSSYDVLKENVNIDIPGEKFEHGWKGGNLQSGNNVIFEEKVLLGSNCTIEDNVTFKNYVTVGSNCIIKESAELNACMIWDNITIGKNTRLTKCLIGNNVHIADNVIIEEGATIADNCSIPEGSKIPEGTKLQPNKVFT